MSIELPKSKVKPERTDPRLLIIYSKVKAGKSTALSMLDNNLIIDTEDGTAYLEALKVKVSSVKDILEVCKAIKKEKNPYKYITIDTVTALEDMVKPYALQLWKQSPIYTDKYVVTDILQVPNGSGYQFLRQAIEQIIEWVSQVCDRCILVCHSKDVAVANSDLTVKDIDLLGKSGRILAAKCDGIGYLYRDDDNNTILSFKRSNKFAECEARPKHLTDKDIVIIENRSGELVSHWDRIYPSEPDSGPDRIPENTVNNIDLEEYIEEEQNIQKKSEKKPKKMNKEIKENKEYNPEDDIFASDISDIS